MQISGMICVLILVLVVDVSRTGNLWDINRMVFSLLTLKKNLLLALLQRTQLLCLFVVASMEKNCT